MRLSARRVGWRWTHVRAAPRNAAIDRSWRIPEATASATAIPQLRFLTPLRAVPQVGMTTFSIDDSAQRERSTIRCSSLIFRSHRPLYHYVHFRFSKSARKSSIAGAACSQTSPAFIKSKALMSTSRGRT